LARGDLPQGANGMDFFVLVRLRHAKYDLLLALFFGLAKGIRMSMLRV
jgi:hypothetical protein